MQRGILYGLGIATLGWAATLVWDANAAWWVVMIATGLAIGSHFEKHH